MMSYRCPACQATIAAWMIKQAQFACPGCQASLVSNSRPLIKRSIAVGILVWVACLLGARHFSGSWGYALVVSIEAGGILAGMLGYLFYRLSVRISRVDGDCHRPIQADR